MKITLDPEDMPDPLRPFSIPTAMPQTRRRDSEAAGVETAGSPACE